MLNALLFKLPFLANTYQLINNLIYILIILLSHEKNILFAV